VGEVPLAPVPARARWVAPFAWRFLAVGSDESAVVTRSGWLDRRTDVVPLAKIQSVRIRQGPLQRRLALADVLVDSPPGPLDATARHRPSHEARALALILLHRARLARRADEEAAAPSGRVRGVSTPRL
jgi:putative membrane protein